MRRLGKKKKKAEKILRAFIYGLLMLLRKLRGNRELRDGFKKSSIGGLQIKCCLFIAQPEEGTRGAEVD